MVNGMTLIAIISWNIGQMNDRPVCSATTRSAPQQRQSSQSVHHVSELWPESEVGICRQFVAARTEHCGDDEEEELVQRDVAGHLSRHLPDGPRPVLQHVAALPPEVVHGHAPQLAEPARTKKKSPELRYMQSLRGLGSCSQPGIREAGMQMLTSTRSPRTRDTPRCWSTPSSAQPQRTELHQCQANERKNT